MGLLLSSSFIIYPLSARVVETPQMISHPTSSILLCSPHTTAFLVSLQWSAGRRVVHLPAGSWDELLRWWLSLYGRPVVSCSSTSFKWLVFFFGALLWGSMIHKHAGRCVWQGSTSVVPWNWEKYSCHSKVVSTLSMLLFSVLSRRVFLAWNPHQS